MKVKITYKALIETLQSHKHVATDSWNDIANTLDIDSHLESLKPHKLETDLWAGIEGALDSKPQGKIKGKGYYLVISLFLTVLAIGLLWVGYKIKQNSGSEIEYAYKSEVIFDKIDYKIENIDSQLEQLGQRFIYENEFLFSRENVDEYKSEIQKIDQAIDRINNIKDQYGLDESMIKLLAKMEREKSALIKKMINKT